MLVLIMLEQFLSSVMVYIMYNVHQKLYVDHCV